MVKRMLLMLAVTALFVAGLGFVKFKQIQTAIGQAAAFQPPPEAVTTVTAAREPWPSSLGVIGTVAAVQGVTCECGPAGDGREDRVRVRAGRAGWSGARAAGHAPGAGAAGGRRGATRPRAPDLRPPQGPARSARGLARGVRSGCRRVPGRRGARGRDSSRHRAQDDPRAVRGHPGSQTDQPRPVPRRRRRRRHAPVARPDLRELRRAAADGRRGSRRTERARADGRGRRRRPHPRRTGHGHRLDLSTSRPGTSSCRRRSPIPTAGCVLGCSSTSTSGSGRARRSSRCRLRRSVMPRMATPCSSSPSSRTRPAGPTAACGSRS